MEGVGVSKGTEPGGLPPEVDPTRPSVARVYDYYLGGSHNFESDRVFGRQALAAMPGLPEILRDNRDFLRRVVRYLCTLGVDQFLDLGSGIPTVGNVHEVAQAVNPAARIVYVDHDAVAVAHSRALLAGNDRAATLHGDIREPVRVLEAAVGTGLLDLGRPLAVLLVSVLHFVRDDEGPADLIADYMAATAPGSYLALSHARRDGQQDAVEVAKVYQRSDSPNPMRMRTHDEIVALFGDLAMVDPGVVLMPLWRPEVDALVPQVPVPADYPGLAGLGRRD
jgi:S-adenosyl methyltransferase